MKPLVLCAAAALLAGSAYAGPANLQITLADPFLAGRPGTTINVIADLSDAVDLAVGDSIVITGSSFDFLCEGCGPPPLAFGMYTDVIGTGFTVLAPVGNCCGDPQTVPGATIGTFAFSPSSLGPVSGFLEIDYAIFSVDPNDPNFDPVVDLIDPDVQAFAAATLDAVPEPGTSLLGFTGVCLGVAMLVLRRRRANAL